MLKTTQRKSEELKQVFDGVIVVYCRSKNKLIKKQKKFVIKSVFGNNLKFQNKKRVMTTPLKAQQFLNEIKLNIPILYEKMKESVKELEKYSEYNEIIEFIENSNEKEEDSIKRAENNWFKQNEMIKRNEISNKKVNETIELLNIMIELFGRIKNKEEKTRKLRVGNNELIDKIIELEERRINKLNVDNQVRKEMFSDKKEEWLNHKIEMEESIKIKVQDIFEKNIPMLCFEIKQIEEWTKLKMGNIIFDSDVDNWKENTSVFDQKIMNKCDLIVLIEDEDDNLFGVYINAKINKVGYCIKDPKAFIFSLKSNGRINGMMKYETIKDSNYSFSLTNRSGDRLFLFGNGDDIVLYKEAKRNESFCYHSSFNYDGNQIALCGKLFPKRFTPKRIVVIQLI